MGRNPIAKAVRKIRPSVVPDKREEVIAREAEKEIKKIIMEKQEG